MLAILLVIVLAVGAYLLALMLSEAGRQACARREIQQSQAQAEAQRRWSQERTEARRRVLARHMQLAILQLAQSPDFRRAASFASQAVRGGVPTGFRQRQFRRLRPLLVEHLAQLLQAGTPLERAAAGLQALVRDLGMQGYEAEYIVVAAQSRHAAPVGRAPNYQERLQTLHVEHQRRLEAIRHMPSLEEELREQLLEAEQERFREVLLNDREGGR